MIRTEYLERKRATARRYAAASSAYLAGGISPEKYREERSIRRAADAARLAEYRRRTGPA
jgi:hypothetical protein